MQNERIQEKYLDILTSGRFKAASFEAVDLNNIDNLYLSGVDIEITGSNLMVSGQSVVLTSTLFTTGNTLASNLFTTGNTLSSNLFTTGNTLQININNLSSTYATITNLSSTGNTLASNLFTTGNTLQVNINNLSSNLITTGTALTTRIGNLSGDCVFLTGNQNISGTKLFQGIHLISGNTDITGNVNISGHIAAVSKAFLISHPLDSNKKLQYGSLEGPENGVYVRGKTNENIINLPDYWSALVDENSISVNLTPIYNQSNLYVIEYNNKYVSTAGNNGLDYFYIVYGERKDIPKLTVEF